MLAGAGVEPLAVGRGAGLITRSRRQVPWSSAVISDDDSGGGVFEAGCCAGFEEAAGEVGAGGGGGGGGAAAMGDPGTSLYHAAWKWHAADASPTTSSPTKKTRLALMTHLRRRLIATVVPRARASTSDATTAFIMRLYLVMTAILALSGSACASERGSLGAASMQSTAGDEVSGWRYYRAGERLVESGKTQDAAVEFRKAEEAFGDKYLVERSMAIYGRARALDLAGRCNEAQDTYHAYADFVGAREPASAKAALAVAATCRQVPADDAALTTVAVALRDGDYARALSLVERIEPSSRLGDAWRAYDRGEALAGLHRIDEALGSFETAEQRFADAGEGERGRPLVAWSKGRALVAAGRCDEAQRAFDGYARLVRERDPQGAAMAMDVARSCTERKSSQ